MFNTLGSFSAVYFTLAAVLFVLILFEKHFIQLEDKIKAKRRAAKKATKAASPKSQSYKRDSSSVRSYDRSKAASVRRIPNNAA